MDYPRLRSFSKYNLQLLDVLTETGHQDVYDEFHAFLQSSQVDAYLLFWKDASEFLNKVEKKIKQDIEGQQSSFTEEVILKKFERLYLTWISFAAEKQVSITYLFRTQLDELFARVDQFLKSEEGKAPSLTEVRDKLIIAHDEVWDMLEDGFGQFKRDALNACTEEIEQLRVNIQNIEKALVNHADEPKRVQELYAKLKDIEAIGESVFAPGDARYNNIVLAARLARNNTSVQIAVQDILKLQDDMVNFRIPNHLPIKDSYNKMLATAKHVGVNFGKDSGEYQKINKIAQQTIRGITARIAGVLFNAQDNFASFPEPSEEKQALFKQRYMGYSKESYYTAMALHPEQFALKDIILAYRHQLRSEIELKSPFVFANPAFDIVRQYQATRGQMEEGRWQADSTEIDPNENLVLELLQQTFDTMNGHQDLTKFDKALIVYGAIESVKHLVPDESRKLNQIIDVLRLGISTTLNQAQLYTDQKTMDFKELVSTYPDAFKKFGLSDKQHKVVAKNESAEGSQKIDLAELEAIEIEQELTEVEDGLTAKINADEKMTIFQELAQGATKDCQTTLAQTGTVETKLAEAPLPGFGEETHDEQKRVPKDQSSKT